ncbi:MAG: CocE/NonD family hydrolase [Planctomycetaceae bacterium]
MRDGVNLATDIYRDDTTNVAPVVLMRTPYNKDRAKGAAERFAVAGYVAVVQDCRGLPFGDDRWTRSSPSSWSRNHNSAQRKTKERDLIPFSPT